MNTSVDVGLISLILLIQVTLSSTFSFPGVSATCNWTSVGLDGRLVPKESLLGWRVTVLTALSMVTSMLASVICFRIRGSGALTCRDIHCRWRVSRWIRIGPTPAIVHRLLPLLPW